MYVVTGNFSGYMVAGKNVTVTGIVTDANKEPLIGVNISILNMPGLGVITDMNGKYNIKVPAYNRLVFPTSVMRLYKC